MIELARFFLKFVKIVGLGIACVMAVYTTLALTQYVGETLEIGFVMRLIKTDYIMEAHEFFKGLYDNTLAHVVEGVKWFVGELEKL